MAGARKVIGKDEDGKPILETDEQMAQRKANPPATYNATRLTGGLTPKAEWDAQFKPRGLAGMVNSGLTPQAEWDKQTKPSLMGQITPELADAVKPRLANPGDPTVPSKLAGVNDVEPLKPAFANLNDDGLNIRLDREEMLNSAQRFEKSGEGIFQGVRMPKSLAFGSKRNLRQRTPMQSVYPW